MGAAIHANAVHSSVTFQGHQPDQPIFTIDRAVMRCKHARLSHAILLSVLLVLVPLAVVLGTCWHDSATRCHELIGYAAAVLAGLSLTGVYTGLAIGWLAAGILLPAPAPENTEDDADGGDTYIQGQLHLRNEWRRSCWPAAHGQWLRRLCQLVPLSCGLCHCTHSFNRPLHGLWLFIPRRYGAQFRRAY